VLRTGHVRVPSEECVSAPPDTQLVGLISTPPTLRASAEQVAASLCDSVGAWACYLALAEQTGRTPRLLAMIGRSQNLPTWRSLDGATLLRRALSKHEPVRTQVGEWPALALPMKNGEHAIGAVLLLYEPGASIDTGRAKASADLAASALESARQVAVLRMHAEQIEEQTRLREIQVSRNLIRGVIDSVPMGLALLDSEGVILAANRALSDLFGFEPAALVGMHYGRGRAGTAHDAAARRRASAARDRQYSISRYQWPATPGRRGVGGYY
jgi:PAS domain-containing protein